MPELKGKQADKFARNMLKVEKEMKKKLIPKYHNKDLNDAFNDGYRLGVQQKADETYENGRSMMKQEIIEKIDKWHFETRKNFSGNDKDFFSTDVQILKSRIEEK